jgi:hypothetical protein
MEMPEATLNKDHRPIFWQNNVRFSWQSSFMQPEAEPILVQA